MRALFPVLIRRPNAVSRGLASRVMGNANTRTVLSGMFVVLCFLTGTAPTIAQNFAPGNQPRKDPSTTQQTKFAPGVVRVIPAQPEPEETFRGPMTLQRFLDAHAEIVFGGDQHPAGQPHYAPQSRTLVDMAQDVVLRREIYCFEFSFKPLRHVYIDVPRPDGRIQRKLVWYMVYRVRYQGGDLRPATDRVAGEDIFRRVEQIHYPQRRFFPSFVLRDHVSDKSYLDQLLPTVKSRIQAREQITAPLYTTIDMTRIAIPYTSDEAAEGVWGVATWVDVDPGIDFLSIEVAGLTNAFEQDGEGDDAPYRRKVLQLNFYRPGDQVNQTEDEIRFGVPAYADPKDQQYILKQYGLDERLDYQWIFR